MSNAQNGNRYIFIYKTIHDYHKPWCIKTQNGKNFIEKSKQHRMQIATDPHLPLPRQMPIPSIFIDQNKHKPIITMLL